MDEDLIMQRLANIERNSLLAAKNVLTVDDAVILTGLSRSHLYKLTCKKQIPHSRPNGKCIYFSRAELENWLLRNRVLCESEAEELAISYSVRNNK